MKKIFYIALILLGVTTSGYSQKFMNGAAEISDIFMQKKTGINSTEIELIFNIKFDGTSLKSNKEYRFTPVIQGENDLKKLPSVLITGRKRQVYRERNPKDFKDDEPLLVVHNHRNKEQKIEYKYTLDFEQWMQGAQLIMEEDECGCGGSVLSQATLQMNKYFVNTDNMIPFLVYVEPEIEENKVRSVVSSANIDFPINSSSVYPEYRNNPIELTMLRGAIDKIVYDPDIRVSNLRLLGHASPDGVYARNAELAKSRTEAVKAYLISLQIPDITSDIIKVDYDPENWKGLEELMKASNYPFKNKVLEIIALEPNLDKRKAKLRALGAPYQILAKEVFPKLRTTDFEVEYSVRRFTPREANILIWTTPQKLSLQEIYTVTEFYSWDNLRYKEIFEIAVRMFPDDYVSNLNASTNALLIKDLQRAEIYLSRIAPDKRDGIYYNNLATLYMFQKKYDAAEMAYVKAIDLGSPEAEKNLAILKYVN